MTDELQRRDYESARRRKVVLGGVLAEVKLPNELPAPAVEVPRDAESGE